MNNVQRLTQAGLILPNAAAALNPADQQLINSLTDDEVSALISVKSKLGDDFAQRNSRTIGIVF
ncbi:MAG TPA: aroma-sacti cluster domain-containing protein [Verrucomicrobiae bacterium]|nr:aroma-sacti cluster domain-containing protein [Verrucomicrobiae bacterium]